MLAILETAITDLLKAVLPPLFTGADAVTLGFPADTWEFDPISADPVAGEPGPEDATDDLAFNPATPAGPYRLTRTPYPGPKRVYLRSAEGELVALGDAEVAWNKADPASFTVALRPGRDTTGFSQLEVLYSIVGAATRLKTRHKFSLEVTGNEPAIDKALALIIAVLALNRATLMVKGGFSWNSGDYESQGSIKSLKFSGGVTAAGSRTVNFEAEVELRVERLLGPDEGKPIAWILSPGKAPVGKAIQIDPSVQS